MLIAGTKPGDRWYRERLLLTNSEAFTSCFNDPSGRQDNPDAWASFGIGTPNMHLSALLNTYDQTYGVELWIDNLEAYERVLPLREEFDARWLAEVGAVPDWDAYDEDKKSRHIVIRNSADYDSDDWNGIYQWIMDWFFRIRELALVANHIETN